MAIANIPRTLWMQVSKPRPLKRKASSEPVGAPSTSGSAPSTKVKLAQDVKREPLLRALSAPRYHKRALKSGVSWVAEDAVSGRIRRHSSKHEVVLHDTPSLTLYRAEGTSDMRMSAINNVLRRAPGVKALTLRVDLTAEEVAELALHLVPHLVSLDLSHNPFGDEGVKALPLECVPRLKHLNLAGCGISIQGVRTLRNDCIRLESVDLRDNALDSERAKAVLRQSAPDLISVDVDARQRPLHH